MNGNFDDPGSKKKRPNLKPPSLSVITSPKTEFISIKRHRVLKLLLSILICVICISLGFMFSPVIAFTLEKGHIVFVIDSFMEAAQDKNITEAYSLLPCRVQRMLPLIELNEILTGDNYDLFDGYSSLEIRLLNSIVGKLHSTGPSLITGKAAKTSGTIFYENGSTGDFEAILEEESDNWRLFFLGIEKETNRGYVGNVYPGDREYYGADEEEFITREAVTFFPKQSEAAVITQISATDGMMQVFVPAGEFRMGDDCPPHIVYLDDYWIDQTEVTNAMFVEFLNSHGFQTKYGEPRLKFNHLLLMENSEGQWEVMSEYEDHPIIWVNWYAAEAYCEWAGRRLPTEAEWEKAARGTDGRHYPWGEGYDCNVAQYSSCGRHTVPVGSFPDGASPYGAMDMAGNVYEWVLDWSDAYYYDYSPTVNPQGPSSGVSRVLRGGSWWFDGQSTNSTHRYWRDPEDIGDGIGFRCAQSP